jgi:pimeloyl-ACP methyl ester carboxylesterase
VNDKIRNPQRRRVLGAALAAATGALAPSIALAEEKAATSDAQPLGICLEGWPYPGPVQFIALEMAGEPVRMAYMDFSPEGAAGRGAILLLHGKNFDSSYWAGPIIFLRRAGFRVVVPDQIGFNKSSKPLCAYKLEDLAANTLALADHLGLQKFAVLGHSTGGMLAVRFASLYPESVTKLLLEDPIGLIDYKSFIPAPSLAALEAAERAATPESYRAFVARYFPKLPKADYEPFVAWRVRMMGSGDYPRFLRVVALTYLMIYSGPVRGLYAQLKPQVLLMAGDKDHGTPFLAFAPPESREKIPGLIDAARDVSREIPKGKLAEFPGVGHVPHLEAPSEFEKVVLEFLLS